MGLTRRSVRYLLADTCSDPNRREVVCLDGDLVRDSGHGAWGILQWKGAAAALRNTLAAGAWIMWPPSALSTPLTLALPSVTAVWPNNRVAPGPGETSAPSSMGQGRQQPHVSPSRGRNGAGKHVTRSDLWSTEKKDRPFFTFNNPYVSCLEPLSHTLWSTLL